MAIGKRTRFEVLKRDNFTCQYCGERSPGTILHVDHIIAVANGGSDDMSNLITACADCNLGKGAVPLDSAAPANDDVDAVADIFGMHHGVDALPDGARTSIRRFVSALGLGPCWDAMFCAVEKISDSDACFRYFCGICWRQIKGVAA